MGEVLEQAFKFYQKREQIISEINTYRQSIQTIEQQMQTFQGKMSRLELRLKINNLNPVLFQKIGLVIAAIVGKGWDTSQDTSVMTRKVVLE